jgi:hypothetical protein
MISKPISVDRTLKGDRLSVSAPIKSGPKSQPSLVQAEKRVPVSPSDFSTIFGRCLV